MGNIRWTNNGSSTLAAGIASGDTSLTIASLTGALFPVVTGSQYAKITVEDILGNIEIMHMTARAGDVLTVVRAQEGTVALAFPSGSRVELRVTAGELSEFLQKTADTMPGAYDCTGGIFTAPSVRDGEVVNSPIRGETGVTSNQFVVPPGGGAPTIGGAVVYTTANLNQAAINALAFPVGTVLMFNGSIGNIPAGFQLCDGTNGTQDMRGKFVIGAGGAYAVGATGGAAAVTSGAGGAHTPTIQGTTLTAGQMPAHSHRIWGTTSGGAGDTESFANTVSAIAGNSNGTKGFLSANAGGQQLIEDNAGGGGSHTHTADSVADHTHTVATLPPYCGLFFIQKV